MRYSPTTHLSKRSMRVVLFFLPILLIGSTALASDVGRCLSADIPAPVILPDGDVVAAGMLTICHRMAYSPVSGLQELSINGKSLGMYVSRSTVGERPESMTGDRRDDRPYLIFFRTERGELELFSYHRSNGDRMTHHVFGTFDRTRVDSHWEPTRSEVSQTKKQRKNKKFDVVAVMESENAVILSAVSP